jgi:hypothetical protein
MRGSKEWSTGRNIRRPKIQKRLIIAANAFDSPNKEALKRF